MNWYLQVLKNYANFSGRARRKEYWMFTLFSTIISIICVVLDEVLGFKYGNYQEDGYLETFYSLAVLLPTIAVGVRRMHDAGKSGWYILIPIYNLILLCTDGEEGPNKWGNNPKEDNNEKMIDLIGTE